MKYGLSEKQLGEIIDFISQHPEVETAVLFGSRALGTWKEASDVDIALHGEKVTFSLAAKMKFNIEEDTYLPFMFDFVAYPTITNDALRKHIDTKGVVIFQRGGREWKETSLSQVCSDISYGYTASAAHEPVGPKFLRITDIVPKQIDWTSVPFCEADAATFEKYKLKDGDIVIARTGATTGHNKTIKNLSHNTVYASYLIRYQIDKTKADPYFVGHILQSTDWYGYVEAIAGGSAQPGANAKQLGSFEFQLPPLPEQRAIASVLSSLDDKIDLLHRQNKTLEAMAETLFRQWFVEEAQEDWDDGVLDDVITVKGGTTPSTKEPTYWDGDIHWTSPRDLSNHNSVFMFDTERKITALGLSQIGSGLLPTGTVLLSSRAPIGYLAISEIPVAINQGYIAIVCDKGLSNYFMFLWCKANMQAIKNAGNGSTFEEISKSNFKALGLVIPPMETLKAFDKTIAPTFEKIRTNQKQLRTLENLRDTLLPKLMSGEVRVEI